MPKTPRRVGLREHLLLASLFAAATLLLAHSDWLWRWDHLIYDATLPIWESPPPQDIVIVAIDEASLNELGRWPWPRRTHAQLVRGLSAAGARVIALDIIFSEADSSDPKGDQALAEAIRESARVVLPVLLEQPRTYGQLIEQMPLPPLAEVAATLGHIHVELDADGLARSVFLLEDWASLDGLRCRWRCCGWRSQRSGQSFPARSLHAPIPRPTSPGHGITTFSFLSSARPAGYREFLTCRHYAANFQRTSFDTNSFSWA